MKRISPEKLKCIEELDISEDARRVAPYVESMLDEVGDQLANARTIAGKDKLESLESTIYGLLFLISLVFVWWLTRWYWGILAGIIGCALGSILLSPTRKKVDRIFATAFVDRMQPYLQGGWRPMTLATLHWRLSNSPDSPQVTQRGEMPVLRRRCR